MRTVPVNQSAGPLPDGCDPTRVIFIVPFLPFVDFAASLATARAAKPVVAASKSLRVIIAFPDKGVGEGNLNAEDHSSLSGVIGSSRMRLPVAWKIALQRVPVIVVHSQHV